MISISAAASVHFESVFTVEKKRTSFCNGENWSQKEQKNNWFDSNEKPFECSRLNPLLALSTLFWIINTTKGRLRHAEPCLSDTRQSMFTQLAINLRKRERQRKIISQAICKMIVLIPFHFAFRILVCDFVFYALFWKLCNFTADTSSLLYRCPLSVPSCFYRCCRMIKRTSQLKRQRQTIA